MAEDLNKSSKKSMKLEINDLIEESWVKRLDMVFDQSHNLGISLKSEEIAQYAEFNKNYLNKIEEFIERLKKIGYLFICQPYPNTFNGNDFYEQNPLKAEIILTKIEEIKFLKVLITNYGYGDPNRISDLYELILITSKDEKLIYEISSVDLVRFYYHGSFIDKDGDIIAINVQKAMDALNKYYS